MQKSFLYHELTEEDFKYKKISDNQILHARVIFNSHIPCLQAITPLHLYGFKFFYILSEFCFTGYNMGWMNEFLLAHLRVDLWGSQLNEMPEENSHVFTEYSISHLN